MLDDNYRTVVQKSKRGYIAPNGMALTPTEEWLSAHDFKQDGNSNCWFCNWPIISHITTSVSCLRIYPGRECIEIVDGDGNTAWLSGCWPPARVIELWKAITGDTLKARKR